MKIRLNRNRQAGNFLIPIALGILVLIIGVIVVVKVVNWCKEHLPPVAPPPPPAQTNGAPNLPPFVAAYTSQGSAYASVSQNPDGSNSTNCDCNSFEFQYQIAVSDTDTNLVLTHAIMPDLTSAAVFTDSMSAWGFTNTIDPRGNYYNLNGTMVDTMPTGLTMDNGVINTAGTNSVVFTVVIERSPDYQNWIPITTNMVYAGQMVDYTDFIQPASAKMFYRGWFLR